MREMAAIEALKSEKADKEVCLCYTSIYRLLNAEYIASVNCNNSLTRRVLLVTKNYVSAMCVVLICPSSTLTVVWRIILVVK